MSDDEIDMLDRLASGWGNSAEVAEAVSKAWCMELVRSPEPGPVVRAEEPR